MLLALAALAAVLAYVWLLRQRELFCLSVRDGKLLLVRGRLPGSLFQAMEDVLARASVRRGAVKAYRTPNGAALAVSGDIDEWSEQRLRNILGTYPAAQLSAAPVVSDRSMGQLLGIAWLAWLLDRR